MIFKADDANTHGGRSPSSRNGAPEPNSAWPVGLPIFEASLFRSLDHMRIVRSVVGTQQTKAYSNIVLAAAESRAISTPSVPLYQRSSVFHTSIIISKLYILT